MRESDSDLAKDVETCSYVHAGQLLYVQKEGRCVVPQMFY